MIWHCFADGALKRISVDRRGRPQTICRLPDPNSPVGGTWGTNGDIIFASGYRLYRTLASGGEPEAALEHPDDPVRHSRPSFLPDGTHFLFYAETPREDRFARSVYVGSLEGGAPKHLFDGRWRAVEYAAGHLMTADAHGALVAYPFDPRSLEIVGDPIPLVSESVAFGWSVSGNVLAARKSIRTQAVAHLELVDREGRGRTQIGEPGDYWSPRLSPDGSRLAVEVHRDNSGGDIEIFEIGGERHERVTFAPDRHNSAVVWSPDGERIAFHRSRGFSTQVLVKTASGASDVEELVDFDVVASPTDWSMDGRHLLIDEHSDDRGWNIWSISMPAEGEPEAFLTTAANEMQGVFSPDGNWVAYASDESGRFEIYLRPFPPAGDARWQLTSDGGEAPKWRGDGRELFYVAPGSRFMALSVSLEARPEWSSPVQLFQHVVRRAPGEIRDLPPYDVTADGETFLLNAGGGQAFPYTVIVNWPELLRASSADR